MIMDNFGLSEKTIAKIHQVFQHYPEIEKAILYGSRAKGTHRRGSDIDLTLIGNGITLSHLLKIENELDDLLLPYTIDLSIYHKISSLDLLEHIDKIGQEFYSRLEV
jgi:uncharacterized protein